MLRRHSEPSDYEPVSYTWGENPVFSRALFCNSGQQRIAITKNVEDMLRFLRKPTRVRYLWIGAICLNQADLEEKSVQVPLMGQIYQQGRKTHVYLGSKSVVTPAFSLLHRLACISTRLDGQERDYVRDVAVNELGLTIEDLSPAIDLLCHPWFTRRWVLQEVALSQHSIVRSGSQSLPWVIFTQSLDVLEDILKKHEVELRGSLADTLDVVRTLHGQKHDILTLLLQFHSNQCSDVRDIVYSLYGMANPASSLPAVDYTAHWSAVFTRLTTHLARCATPPIEMLFLNLVTFGSLGAKEGPPTSSWVPDWSAKLDYQLHPVSQAMGKAGPRASEPGSRDGSVWHMQAYYGEVGQLLGPLTPMTSAMQFVRFMEDIARLVAQTWIVFTKLLSNTSRSKHVVHADIIKRIFNMTFSGTKAAASPHTLATWPVDKNFMQGLLASCYSDVYPGDPGILSLFADRPSSQLPLNEALGMWNNKMQNSALCFGAASPQLYPHVASEVSHPTRVADFAMPSLVFVPKCASEGDVMVGFQHGHDDSSRGIVMSAVLHAEDRRLLSSAPLVNYSRGEAAADVDSETDADTPAGADPATEGRWRKSAGIYSLVGRAYGCSVIADQRSQDLILI
jgi:hypothetical protein